MSENQKNSLEKLLKKNGKSKRELATFLDVHENGINRILSNRNISLKRLEEIAGFLELDIAIMLKTIYPAELGESKSYRVAEYDRHDNNDDLLVSLFKIIENQKIINDLERKNSETLAKLMNSYVRENE
ncbi:hypothetical protein AGMMS50262_07560 [Bacteroidia bacterium]|nr:hypothetical protein AGMMS50262_07560 [Bacteroidia bacterium]